MTKVQYYQPTNDIIINSNFDNNNLVRQNSRKLNGEKIQRENSRKSDESKAKNFQKQASLKSKKSNKSGVGFRNHAEADFKVNEDTRLDSNPPHINIYNNNYKFSQNTAAMTIKELKPETKNQQKQNLENQQNNRNLQVEIIDADDDYEFDSKDQESISDLGY